MSIDKKSLRIKELSIGRMPGFRSGMVPLSDLSPNINIITGPNAAGKSTTARAIQKLIWQQDTDQIHIDGQAEIGAEPWTIRIESSRHVVQRKGVDDEMRGIPSAEERNRYMLALHELIKDDGEDLAERIIRESVGGYDPDRAGEELNYNDRISTTGTGQYKTYSEAEKAVRESKESQKKIKEEEQKLSTLYRQREEAEEAAKKAALYDLAAQKLKAEKAYQELSGQKSQFPEVLGKAHGEELKRVQEIESEIAGAKESIRAAEINIGECRNQLKRLDIPETGVSEMDLNDLEHRTKKISDLETEIADLEAERKKLEKSRDEALRQIGKDVSPEEWTGLNLDEIGDLDQFLQEAHRVAGEKRILEKEFDELENESQPVTGDRDQINQGITSLAQWLKEVPKGQKFPSWVIISIAVLAVGSAAAGYMIPLAGLIGLIIILVIAVYGLMLLRNKDDHQKEEFLAENYEKTGLTLPEAWNPERVAERLDGLTSELKEVIWQERIHQRLDHKKDRLKDLSGRTEQVQQQADVLKNRLSAMPDLPFDEPVSYTELAVFIKYVQQWQTVHSELVSLLEKLGERKEQFRRELETISNLIKKYTAEEIVDSAQAVAAYRSLKKQEEQRLKNEEEIGRQRKTIETQQDFFTRKQEELSEIYGKFGLPVGEKEKLRQLLDQLDEYNRVDKEFDIARREFSKAQRAMEEHSLFEQEHHRIEELSPDQVAETQQMLAEKAELVNSLRDEIAEIEAKVNAVKSGSSLEKALKDRGEAVEGLKELYQENLSSITGQLLVDELKEQMREQNRPKVFKEANRLFNRITKGRYELEIDEKETPDFRAYDTVEKIGRSLDELSSGTRIQLLMAVRLAFVEMQESVVRLPILADELLANSDDVRARAIIEALTEISREGRQVFYFTAQGDEVSKWESYLKTNGTVDHKVYRLTGERSKAGYKAPKPERDSFTFVKNVPEPGLLSYKQYGKTLNVPGFNPLSEDPEQLHLWYLMDDPDLLYKAHSSGIEYWGAFKSYLDEGGVIKGLDEKEIKKIEEKADLLERYLQLYRQGRPRPIDRSVLEESGSVSDSFIDAVSEKLKELNGNPAELLAALRNSEVSGFRTNKMEDLENYFLEQEYLDAREPMDSDSLRVALQAYISNLELSVKEAERFLERLNSGEN